MIEGDIKEKTDKYRQTKLFISDGKFKILKRKNLKDVAECSKKQKQIKF